jgi:hypothetical protein
VRDHENLESLQPPKGKFPSEREVGYRSGYPRGGSRGAKFRGYSQSDARGPAVYQKKSFKDDDTSHLRPIKLSPHIKDEDLQPPPLEIIHEDPNAVDESAILHHPEPSQHKSSIAAAGGAVVA